MSSPIPLLRTVRHLLSEPGRWTDGALARNAAGKPVPYNSATATSWCLVGALNRHSALGGWVTALRYLTKLANHASLRTFNDCKGREAVLALLTSAEELASLTYFHETPEQMEIDYHAQRDPLRDHLQPQRS